MKDGHQKIYPIAEPDLKGNEVAYVTDAIANESKVSSFGKYLDKFEAYGKEYFHRAFALSSSSGTSALHLALLGLGIGYGDEVIVPTLTFAATASVVVHCGATPVFVDVKDEDWQLDESLLDSLLTPNTKALIAVDLYGVPCNYQAIEVWCKKHNIFLIEDAAEAHGAVYQGRPAGSFGIISCFSFYGNKIITTGEGGMVLTDDKALFERMRLLKNHGMTNPGTYKHEVIGYNYRMTNLQAAVGCAQFERFAEFQKNRNEHHMMYLELLRGVPQVKFQEYDKNVIMPAHWLETIRLTVSREKVAARLKENGIDTRPIFIPLHKQKAFERFANGKQFPVADRINQEGLSLPSSTLISNPDIRFITNTLKEAIALAE